MFLGFKVLLCGSLTLLRVIARAFGCRGCSSHCHISCASACRSVLIDIVHSSHWAVLVLDIFVVEELTEQEVNNTIRILDYWSFVLKRSCLNSIRHIRVDNFG